MEIISLKVNKRTVSTKGNLHSIRNSGSIPGIIYGKEDPIPCSVDAREFAKILHNHSGENLLMKLALDDKQEKIVILKSQAIDPVSRGILHVDFMQISMKDKINVPVHVKLTGESAGVKEGGVLDIHMREINVRCLPTQIPESITVDVTALKIGETIHIRDIAMPDDVQCEDELDRAIVSVVAIKIEEEVVAAPTEEALKEPELIKKERAEKEAAEGEAEKKEKPGKDKKEEKKG